jgi:hypothetical protein
VPHLQQQQLLTTQQRITQLLQQLQFLRSSSSSSQSDLDKLLSSHTHTDTNNEGVVSRQYRNFVQYLKAMMVRVLTRGRPFTREQMYAHVALSDWYR